jgi:hypothetical protein
MSRHVHHIIAYFRMGGGVNMMLNLLWLYLAMSGLTTYLFCMVAALNPKQ